MAARVTPNDVKDILETALTNASLLKCIGTANTVVNVNLLAQGYDDNLLTEIELWLAAHFACIRDPRMHSQGVHNSQTTYEGQTGQGFAASTYGEQAMRLDFNKVLARIDASLPPTATLPSSFDVF